MIAPYWDDIDLRNKGSVLYNSFNVLNGLEVLKNVSSFINSVQRSQSMFKASSVVVVYWRETCPFGDSRCSNVSLFIFVYYTNLG